LVARYDITRKLDAPSSWETFQTSQLRPDATGFDHASWDGRYFYFMTGTDSMIGSTGIIARYDTTAAFNDKTSWTTFDINSVVPAHNPKPLFGGGVVFDGEYIYVASSNTPVVMRFDARTPRKMPQGFSGSFY
jgi:hypothetical protein